MTPTGDDEGQAGRPGDRPTVGPFSVLGILVLTQVVGLTLTSLLGLAYASSRIAEVLVTLVGAVLMALPLGSVYGVALGMRQLRARPGDRHLELGITANVLYLLVGGFFLLVLLQVKV